MVDTIQPRQYFPISRLLTDPTDNSTYYLSAEIRNAKTGVVIATVNLSQISGRLYAVNYQMPADPSGQGLFITITTFVYTDAGRTTKSDAYGEEHEIFLVYDRFNFLQGLGNQVAALIDTSDATDYKKIKKIVDEAVEKGSNAVIKEIPEEVNIDLDPVLSSLKKVAQAVDKIEIPEPIRTDYDRIAKGHTVIVDALKKELSDIETNIINAIPEPTKPTNMQPVLESIEKTFGAPFLEKTNKLLAKIEELTKADVSDTLEDVKKIKEAMYEFLFNLGKIPQKESQKTGVHQELNRFGKLITRNQ